jgi:hypothetical protein
MSGGIRAMIADDTTPENGFASRADHPRDEKRHRAALAELIAGAALTTGTIAVVAVLSLGIARAENVAGLVHPDGAVSIATLLGFLFAAMSCLTALAIYGNNR